MIRKATAVWNGDLKGGNGNLTTETGTLKNTQYSFASRFESGTGTNPEELLGAAHAGCFSMALAAGLANAGHKPETVSTTAKVHLSKLDGGFKINLIELECEARIPGLDERTFMEFAEKTKTGCIVSQALSAVEMKLTAKLLN